MKEAIKRLIPANNKKSREVFEEDLVRVLEDGSVLFKLCYASIGKYSGCYAVAHSQIDNIDPLNFFVTREIKIIINPKIIKHSNYTVESKEGCLTFNNHPEKIVKRWQKCEVEYQEIEDNKLSPIKTIKLSGKEAFIWQHEIDHGLGILIY